MVDAFFEVMGVVDAMPDERDLYTMKGLHFERLSVKREGESSLRLNKQFRLIVTLERDDRGPLLAVHAIEDYHP